MISFRNVWLDDPLTGAVIENASFDLTAHDHRAVLCSSAAERTALVQLISGWSSPDRGDVSLPEAMSFPVGSNHVLHMPFSITNNIKLLAKLFGLRVSDLQEFLNIMVGTLYNPLTPLNKLPQQEKQSIALTLSYGVPFTHYLAETFALPPNGGAAYGNLLRYIQYLDTRRQGLLLITQVPARAMDACTCGSVLKKGKLVHYDNISDAVNQFKKTMPRPGKKPQRSDEVDT